MVTGPQISLKNISLSFGEEPVFEKLNLLIHPRDRIALVGRNGSGKSTLLKVLQGLVSQDEGERMLSKGLSIGYMEQDPILCEFSTLNEYVIALLAIPELEETSKSTLVSRLISSLHDAKISVIEIGGITSCSSIK